jgi:succinate dehydrogenase / fumarate reductase membrane anchor subunit
MRFRTPLYNVRGLGSAKEGTHHWWMQRVTALALVPLMLWLAFSVASIGGLGYAQAVAWVRSPVNSVLLLGCIIAVFYHGLLGLQVVIEDYVHHEGGKLASLVALKFLTLLLGIASALSVLRVAISG